MSDAPLNTRHQKALLPYLRSLGRHPLPVAHRDRSRL